ncbi:beta-N-acetylhexosaminidase [Teredinibacter franksiae]|uniref:beta-N-acetylhexosaminidase n=1 Tax=Teredinibacter franksiae TaxID=2761453 RepID=UPI001624AFD1|nr:beta-N-acetylhexosaminidase [Teredinibacter franksiae]
MFTETTLGPVVIDIAGTFLDDSDKELLSNPWVGGVILFTRNYSSVIQLQALTSAIKAINANLIIAVDHEGGRVQRFREGFTRIPTMQSVGNRFLIDAVEGLRCAREAGWLMAAELIASGLDISFAPVLDVDESLSDIIGDRSFGVSPNVVVQVARAFMAGMKEAGMANTGKHFPGHGGVRADSHLELPVDSRELKALESRDIVPFKALGAELDALMPAHILFPAIDAEPVGFSSWWIRQYLRQELQFKGVVFSDDLSMEGATGAGGYGSRALAALSAGCDAILVCNNRDGVLEVLHTLSTSLDKVPASRLESMSANVTQEWGALRQSERWNGAREILQNL